MKLVNRQRLHAVEPHLTDVRQLALDIQKRRPVLVETVVASGEAADVELIDDEILELRRIEWSPLERIGGEYDRTVATRRVGSREFGIDHVASGGIEPLERIAAVL